MKKILTICLLSGFLFSCDAVSEKEMTVATAPPAENATELDQPATGLVFNNGEKWKADASTVENAANLKAVIAAAKTETLEDYTTTAAALQEGLNKMVKECKMKGADHDALHVWLEPMMTKTKELSKATTSADAATTLQELETQVNLFPQYFQQ